MGELRVFYKVKDCKFDLWEFLGLSKSIPEKRTDIYFNLSDKRFGLKLRHGSVLELKELQKVDPNTQVEFWAKTIQTHFPTSIQQTQNWRQELEPMIGRSVAASTILHLLSDFHSGKLVTINKSRKSRFLNLDNYKFPPPAHVGSCHAEQVEISLESEGISEQYRSICFEGEARVLKNVMAEVCKHVQGHIICGYPEFIHIAINNKSNPI